MEENRKEYSIIGTVTIGTDEYRDLITEKFQAIREKEEEHDRWYDQYKETQKYKEECGALKKQVEALKSKIAKCEKFMKKNAVSISEDNITFFTTVFGEDE